MSFPWGYGHKDNKGVCRPKVETVYDGTLTLFEKMCKLVGVVLGLEDTVEEIDEKVDGFDARITKNTEDISVNVTNINGVEITAENNRDQIMYLVSQFSDGQTGLVIDGGFFEETGIKKNYDGGVF